MSQPSSSDNENYSLRKINQLAFDSEKDSSLSLGQFGAVYVADTTQTNGNFGAIQAIEGAVITLTASNWTPGTATAIPLPAGATIFGSFSTFTLTSGKVIAYRNA